MDEIIVRLGHWEPAVRAGAAALAGTQRITPAILLIRALVDPITDVRRAAVVALGEIGATEAVQPLITTLQTDPDGVVRRRAASALGGIGDPRAIEPLLSALQNIRAGVTGYAALALDALGASWSAPFAERIGVPDAEQRRQILITLHRFQRQGQRPRGVLELGRWPAQGLAALASLLTDPDSKVRWWAVAGLRGHGAAAFAIVEPSLLDPDPEVRSQAIDVLAEVDPEQAVPALIASLEDQNPNVRWDAARILGQLGDARALPALRRLRATDTEETTAIAYARRISEVAQDAIWDIHRRHNPNLFQIGEIIYERVGGELRPAPNWEQDTW